VGVGVCASEECGSKVKKVKAKKKKAQTIPRLIEKFSGWKKDGWRFNFYSDNQLKNKK
jgi:hypothetical protein